MDPSDKPDGQIALIEGRCRRTLEFIQEFYAVLIGCDAPDERETISWMQSWVKGALDDQYILAGMFVQSGIGAMLQAEDAVLSKIPCWKALSDNEAEVLANIKVASDGVPPIPVEVALSRPHQDWYPHLVDLDDAIRINLSMRAASRILRRWCDGLSHLTASNLLMISAVQSIEISENTGTVAVSTILKSYVAVSLAAHGIDTLRGAQGWAGPRPDWMPNAVKGNAAPP